MSRDIYLSYRRLTDGTDTSIEVPAPYHLFGTERSSKEFWSLHKLREIGIARLIDLGDSAPVYFGGWDDLDALDREIALIWRHSSEIDFHPELKASWLAHLVYCSSLLRLLTPPECEPVVSIG